jgi:hypothetical protein
VLLAGALLAGGCSSITTPPVDSGVSVDAFVEASTDTGAAADTGAPAEASTDAGNAPEGGAADTWDSWAQGFFASYCVECHTASDPTGRNYTLQADVVKDKLEIRCGVSGTQDPSWMCGAFPPARQFPIDNATKTNPKPTDAERARAVAWVTAGCP